MVLYNTLMGVCAGGIILLTVHMIRVIASGDRGSRATGFAYLGFGVPLLPLSLHMALTWPLTANPPINIIFAEPNVVLAVLAISAGITLISTGVNWAALDLRYPMWVVAVVGLTLLASSLAIFRFNLVGDAPHEFPAFEPITGNWQGWENTFFGVIYMLAAIGALVAPWALSSPVLRALQRGSWLIAGWSFLLFSALNYYTHIGLLINIEHGTRYTW